MVQEVSYNDDDTFVITDQGRAVTKKSRELLEEGWELDEVANFIGLPSTTHLKILLLLDSDDRQD